MEVVLAKNAGFCMGVRRAVDTTLDMVQKGEDKIATFGPLIHNPQVLERLQQHGVNILHEIPAQATGTIIIRAHGVPPDKKKKLEDLGARVEDATCPRVMKVQAIIAKYKNQGYSTVIIGDLDHAEVEGLMGFTGSSGQVVSNEADVDALKLKLPYIIVSQTTQDQVAFDKLKEMILDKYPGGKVFNTICDSTHKRQEEVRQLCGQVEAMVVVGGKTSANTQRLGDIAKGLGCPVFMVETEDDLDLAALSNYKKVGVTAGASTPNWVICKVVEVIKGLAD
ncbi:MAG: 4-hydroxy-3-methylbut-2-enyl diphosphate reductase [Desulfobulbaceae bacterium]|nr:4-hydroxy-3-methylbut-2-enyl diphosphate reductase [Desulfobulbaceae bacterium]HIJ77847.1 4-hydroxy-3-methylbut-2-enyl diphosphate reductase [Deltaproteobacteria bacterium]